MAKTIASAKAKLFVSYARLDMDFANRLVAALEARNFQVLIDHRDLPALEDWQRELLGFIRDADTVLCIVSPSFITSDMCAWEIAQAAILEKRVAPVVFSKVDSDSLPDTVSRI